MPAMSKFCNSAAVLLAAFVAQTSAHTYVKEFQAGGKTYAGFYASDKSGGDDSSPSWRTNQGTGFQPVYGDAINTADFIAHIDAEPSPFTAPVDAGSDVKFTWEHEGECQGGEVGWDCSHHGFTATYLAPCDGDCASVDKTSLKFFKIHSAGLIDYREGRYNEGSPTETTGYWGTDAIFYDNGNTQTVTIPKDLPSGNYVLRTEVMSIHNNGDVSQRQFWPQALNIKIEGGNDAAEIPAGTLGTDLYNSSDELLTWDLYQHTAGKTLAAPGPALAPCAEPGYVAGSGSGSGSGSSSSAAAAAPSTTTSAAVVKSSAAATISSAPAKSTNTGYVKPVATSVVVSEAKAVVTPTATTQVAGVATVVETAYVTAVVSAPASSGTASGPVATPAPEDDEYPSWGEGRSHWRTHPRDFDA